MTSHQNIQFHKKIMIKDHQEDVKASGACELCLNKHAAWYCSSDDAFLCNVCDESVHSANQVATKHERICLRTNEILSDVVRGTTSKLVWHSGFRRKARTPRVHDDKRRRKREEPRVPEIRGEGMFLIPEKHDYHDDGNDDDLTSLVPEFQGFTDMGFFFSNDNGIEETTREFNFEDEIEAMEDLYNNEEGEAKQGREEACPEPYLVSCKKDYDNVIGIITKTEEDYDSNKRNMLLRLNYENVIEAWDKQEFPREATRYQTKFNNKSNFQLVPHGMMEKTVSSKSEREARVWRYKDKRKNRLFEKKIRYEVRKVNADKRPRMKGRFVRRSLTIDS